MPSLITNPSDIGKGVRAPAALYEGVFTPITGSRGPSGEILGPIGTYSLQINKDEYVQPWTNSSQGNLPIVARPYSDAIPVGRVVDEPLSFVQGVDITSSTAVTLSDRKDMRRATIDWLGCDQIIRAKVREAVKAGTVLGFSATGSDWTTTSVPSTASLDPARVVGVLLDSSSAAGSHAILVR